MGNTECMAGLLSTLINIGFILDAVILFSILFMQSRIILGCIRNHSSTLYQKIVPSNSGGYGNDVFGLYGVLIFWRFNRELRKDKEVLAACRGIYNVYLSLLAAFVILTLFLIIAFSAC